MGYDVIMVLIGSFLGFFISILTIIVSNSLQQRGNLKIYSKIVYSKIVENTTWGFFDDGDSITFRVPIWFEVLNTSNVVKVLRNVNIVLFYDDIEICPMTQIQEGYRKEKGEKQTHIFEHKSAYSFTIMPRSIERFECSFIIKKNKVPNDSNFNEMRFSYYDDRDKRRMLFLKKIQNCWEISNNEADVDWMLLS